MRQTEDESQHSPLINDEGRRLLRWMKEHPCAPRFTYECGDHLDFAGWAQLKGFEMLLRSEERSWPPNWLEEFSAHALAQVPHYRTYPQGLSFQEVPPLDKETLRNDPSSLVPDDQSLEGMVVYDTSGTTGNKMLVPSAPMVSASYLPLLRYGLSLYGVDLLAGPGQVGLLQVGLQKSTLTYAMISTFLDQAGFAKLNLSVDEWKDPADRAAYIDACAPQVMTGNPLAFHELSRLDLKHRPKALVSSAMTLMPGARQALEAHFGCPVFDMYSMTECMAIALKRDESTGHRILSHDLYVETLDDQARPCPDGERGEVALTGGRNPYLPMLRYRTRDHAIMEVRDGAAYLMNLEGRSPVRFHTLKGVTFNNIDVTHGLAGLPLVQFSLHQNADHSLHMRYRGQVQPEQLQEALRNLFGREVKLELQAVQAWEVGEREKWIQYSSDLEK